MDYKSIIPHGQSTWQSPQKVGLGPQGKKWTWQTWCNCSKTSDILEQLHQDIDTWYYHETLRNDRGDTKNDDFWYTCLPDFVTHIKSSGTMRDTQKTITISATSFRECSKFSPLLTW